MSFRACEVSWGTKCFQPSREDNHTTYNKKGVEPWSNLTILEPEKVEPAHLGRLKEEAKNGTSSLSTNKIRGATGLEWVLAQLH